MAKKKKFRHGHKPMFDNTAKAYLSGYNDGLKQSNIRGFEASNLMMLRAYYNVIDDHIKTFKTQAALARAIEAEMIRIFAEEFASDIDNIARAISKLNEIRRKYGMELIEWDNTPPQAVSNAKSLRYQEYLAKDREAVL